MSNSTLHNTAGRTQAVNISTRRKEWSVTRDEGGGGEEEKDNKAMWMKARKSRLTLQSQKPESSRFAGRALARKNVKSFNCNVTFSLEVGMSETPLSRPREIKQYPSLSTISRVIRGEGEGERLFPRCVRAPTN